MDLHSPRELMRVIARNGKRMAIFVVGVALLAAGVVMLVLPGPGLLVIIAGLAVLATEFAWAERLLDRAKEQAERAKDKARSTWRSRRKAKKVEAQAAD
ncbi:MAG TPA: PGPGW domain-containing protein, partial [Acidimicrobiales bacterium]|nr:PGPGW domain-containing protein [Acidimicrobiales bacterium]